MDPTSPNTEPGDTDIQSALATALAGRTFLSSAIDGRTLVDGTEVRLSFQIDALNAHAGCNTLGTTAAYDGATLVATDMFQTEIGCEPALAEQDLWLGELLMSRPTLVLEGDTLTIASPDTTITLTDRAVADPDRPLVDTTWVVNGLISGDAVSSVPANSAASITISDGSAAVHTGCNRGNAGVEITDDTITFAPMATTKMACEPELMELEFAVTRVLTGEVDYSIEAGQMTISTKDADGGTIGLTLTAE